VEKALRENRIIVNKSLEQKERFGQFDSNPITNPKRLIELSPSHVNQQGMNAADRFGNSAELAATLNHEPKHAAGQDEKAPYQGDIDFMTGLLQKLKGRLNNGDFGLEDEGTLRSKINSIETRLSDTVNRARKGHSSFKDVFPYQKIIKRKTE
jgi:hypothetical protein